MLDMTWPVDACVDCFRFAVGVVHLGVWLRPVDLSHCLRFACCCFSPNISSSVGGMSTDKPVDVSRCVDFWRQFPSGPWLVGIGWSQVVHQCSILIGLGCLLCWTLDFGRDQVEKLCPKEFCPVEDCAIMGRCRKNSFLRSFIYVRRRENLLC